MAKQTMVLKVPPMSSEKSRTKAMKIVVTTYGVTGVRWEKEGKVMVEGEGVDIFELVQTLRKKVGYTEIINVMEEGDQGVDLFALLVQTLRKKLGY